jgi:hypothetical protein
VLTPLRLLVLLAAGAAAVVVAVHLAFAGPGVSGGLVAGVAPSAPRPGIQVVLPTTSPAAPPADAGVLPRLGQRINDETAAVARGQMSILDELERAIADQIRSIIHRVEGR